MTQCSHCHDLVTIQQIRTITPEGLIFHHDCFDEMMNPNQSIESLFDEVETGGVRQCKSCESWITDDIDEMQEHISKCKESVQN